jgi:hypothetical protein
MACGVTARNAHVKAIHSNIPPVNPDFLRRMPGIIDKACFFAQQNPPDAGPRRSHATRSGNASTSLRFYGVQLATKRADYWRTTSQFPESDRDGKPPACAEGSCLYSSFQLTC